MLEKHEDAFQTMPLLIVVSSHRTTYSSDSAHTSARSLCIIAPLIQAMHTNSYKKNRYMHRQEKAEKEIIPRIICPVQKRQAPNRDVDAQAKLKPVIRRIRSAPAIPHTHMCITYHSFSPPPPPAALLRWLDPRLRAFPLVAASLSAGGFLLCRRMDLGPKSVSLYSHAARRSNLMSKFPCC